MERFKNLFRKNKIDISDIATQATKATDEVANAGKSLAKGTDIVEGTAKLAGSTGRETAKNLFKSELKNKFVLAITVAAALPRIQEEVIPAFKEKGFIEGIKTTGKIALRTIGDFVSNAGFSAIGRALGSAIGTVICPGVGSAVGGTFGDVIGSFFSMKLVSKIFDKNKKEDAQKPQNVDMLG